MLKGIKKRNFFSGRIKKRLERFGLSEKLTRFNKWFAVRVFERRYNEFKEIKKIKNGNKRDVSLILFFLNRFCGKDVRNYFPGRLTYKFLLPKNIENQFDYFYYKFADLKKRREENLRRMVAGIEGLQERIDEGTSIVSALSFHPSVLQKCSIEKQDFSGEFRHDIINKVMLVKGNLDLIKSSAELELKRTEKA